MNMEKPDWDDYFMKIAEIVKSRSSCSRRQVGAILVKDKRIISTGYNGTPKKIKNCNEGGCERCNSEVESGKDLDKCSCCHAEENSIVQAAVHGIKTEDSVLYTTTSVCTSCSKMIINAGIKEIIFNDEYPDQLGMKILEEAGIKITKVNQ